MNLFAIFLTGLTTGGLSCLAMQGGLLASTIANQKNEESKLKNKKFALGKFDSLDWVPVGMFLGSKLVTHTILGFLLGSLGEVITLSLNVRIGFQVFTAFFMLATALNLLNVHPIFRFVVIKPPKFIFRFVKDKTKSRAYFTPAILGALTVFIPCGVTQAMEVLAINSGDPIQGALIMFSFVLGTSPLFAILGVATAKISEGWYKVFTQISAIVLILMSLYFVNGAMIAGGSPLLFGSVDAISDNSQANMVSEGGVQKVVIKVVESGYQPSYVKVKSGAPVELTLQSSEVYSCALYFVFREFGIQAFLEPTDSKTFTFTPNKKGKYVYSCSMGMYKGIMEVI